MAPRTDQSSAPPWRLFVVRRLVALVCLLALVSTAPWFAAAHWLADLLSHLVPHVLVAAGIIALGLAASRRPRWTLAAAVIVAVQAVRLAPFYSTTCLGPLESQAHDCFAGTVRAPADDSFTVRIAQWNVNRANTRVADVVEWLESTSGIDVIVLLEVTPAWVRALERLGRDHPHARIVPRSDNFGIAVLSRLPGSRLAERPIGAIGLPSIVLDIGDDSVPVLRIIATHPGPPLGGALWRARNEQLASLALEVPVPPPPTVVVGDLNATRWSPALSGLMRDADLGDAQRGRGYVATWAPAALPIALGLPIDHTLVSPGIVVLDRVHGPRLGSDHRVIVTELAVVDPR